MDNNNIPDAIILFDIEKASQKHSNFGDQFISWIETIHSCRKSYILNNGFLTESIDMDKGIFRVCPISLYLFLLIILKQWLSPVIKTTTLEVFLLRKAS